MATGQTSYPGYGVVPAMISGILAAEAVQAQTEAPGADGLPRT